MEKKGKNISSREVDYGDAKENEQGEVVGVHENDLDAIHIYQLPKISAMLYETLKVSMGKNGERLKK